MQCCICASDIVSRQLDGCVHRLGKVRARGNICLCYVWFSHGCRSRHATQQTMPTWYLGELTSSLMRQVVSYKIITGFTDSNERTNERTSIDCYQLSISTSNGIRCSILAHLSHTNEIMVTETPNQLAWNVHYMHTCHCCCYALSNHWRFLRAVQIFTFTLLSLITVRSLISDWCLLRWFHQNHSGYTLSIDIGERITKWLRLHFLVGTNDYI